MEISMLVRGGIALTVVAGGITLGAMLGTAANPEMKKPPEQPWLSALPAPVAPDRGYTLMVEAGPQDLSPYRDSYAPTWAHEEQADWEPDYPAWSYSDGADQRFAAAGTDQPHIDEQSVATGAEVTVSSQASAEPVVPVDLAPQSPADPAPYVRLAAHLEPVY